MKCRKKPVAGVEDANMTTSSDAELLQQVREWVDTDVPLYAEFMRRWEARLEEHPLRKFLCIALHDRRL